VHQARANNHEEAQRQAARQLADAILAAMDAVADAGPQTPTPPIVTAPEDRLLVTREEAARLLSVSPSTIDQLRRDGELEVVYIGSAPRFPVEGLRRFCEARARAGPE
jgi:excisionase family DNA binding protein